MDSVRETLLDWFEVETADSAHWKAATPDGDYDVIDCGSLGVKWSGPTGYEADDWRTCATIKAAKDECENHAQRITSALAQPSGVVSDDTVEAHPRYQSLLSEFAARGRHNDALIEVIRDAAKAEETCKQLAGIRSSWAGRDPAACVLIAKAEEKLAAQSALISAEPTLTAALASPVSEGEIRAKVIEEAIVFFQDNIRGILSVEDRSEDLNEELAEPVHSTISCLRGYLAHIRARSLTNGEG